MPEQKSLLTEVLPKAGLVYSEKSTLSEILSKPKIMPIKSLTLEKLEELEREMLSTFSAQNKPASSMGDRPTTRS